MNWCFQVGLIKGILNYLEVMSAARQTRSSPTENENENDVVDHTVVDRGFEWRNSRCAVCKHLINKGKLRGQPSRSKYWCPHPDCRAHVCAKHRNIIHSFTRKGINLSKYHKPNRVAYTKAHPGCHYKPPNSGRKRKK